MEDEMINYKGIKSAFYPSEDKWMRERHTKDRKTKKLTYDI
jgi:hypothetical protein